MSELAVLGGKPVIHRPFRTVGKEAADAAHAVVSTGQLSGFVGADVPEFFGGPQVQALEEDASDYFDVNHTVTFNAWTSGLTAALEAFGVQPGDEVIISHWTMSACPMSIMEWGATPVFADVSVDTFNLTASTIASVVTPRTVGVLVPEIFGHPADHDGIMSLAGTLGLFVLADAAQSPGATHKNRFAGTSARVLIVHADAADFPLPPSTGEGGLILMLNPFGQRPPHTLLQNSLMRLTSADFLALASVIALLAPLIDSVLGCTRIRNDAANSSLICPRGRVETTAPKGTRTLA